MMKEIQRPVAAMALWRKKAFFRWKITTIRGLAAGGNHNVAKGHDESELRQLMEK
jgi:hypothetical protein